MDDGKREAVGQVVQEIHHRNWKISCFWAQQRGAEPRWSRSLRKEARMLVTQRYFSDHNDHTFQEMKDISHTVEIVKCQVASSCKLHRVLRCHKATMTYTHTPHATTRDSRHCFRNHSQPFKTFTQETLDRLKFHVPIVNLRRFLSESYWSPRVTAPGRKSGLVFHHEEPTWLH